MTWGWTRPVLLAALLLALGPAGPAAEEAGERVVRRGGAADDLYLAGRRVEVLGEVDGDVVAAGGSVAVGERVRGDVIVAGGFVTIDGEVADDVRAAGGDLVVDARIGGDLIAAGGDVSLTPATAVGGRAWLAGGEVEVPARIDRSLRVAAGTVRIAGEVGGDADLAAEEIVILPSARIRGNLTYWSPKPAAIDPSARIEGAITHREPAVPEEAASATRAALTVASVLLLVGLIVAGIVLFLLLPQFTLGAARTVGTDPWKSLALGFALLVATPVAAVLLMVTVIGLPLGLTVLALYFVSLLLGILTAAFFLGDAGARLVRRAPTVSRGWQAAAFVAALVVLWLLQQVPVVGGPILFLALLLGLGAASLRVYRAYAGAQARPLPS